MSRRLIDERFASTHCVPDILVLTQIMTNNTAITAKVTLTTAI
jgi:hypothetical protein